jgi:hypothetical protein
MKYIQKHMWADTEPTAGILNGRWDRHVWEDALSNVDEATKKGIDPKLFKKWLSITTNKLFETQSALSRHRIKLSKRLKDRIFERPKYIHPLLKKQLIENNAVLYIPEQERMRSNCKQVLLDTKGSKAFTGRKRKTTYLTQEPQTKRYKSSVIHRSATERQSKMTHDEERRAPITAAKRKWLTVAQYTETSKKI